MSTGLLGEKIRNKTMDGLLWKCCCYSELSSYLDETCRLLSRKKNRSEGKVFAVDEIKRIQPWEALTEEDLLYLLTCKFCFIHVSHLLSKMPSESLATRKKNFKNSPECFCIVESVFDLLPAHSFSPASGFFMTWNKIDLKEKED